MQITTNERLTAGQSHTIDSQRRADSHNPFDLFEGKQMLLRHELNIFRRHAIETANIAAIGHTDSEIVVHSTERIDQSARTVRWMDHRSLSLQSVSVGKPGCCHSSRPSE